MPKSPQLRRILLAYTVNELGTWFGYVALALAVYDQTHSAIATGALFVSRGLLPALLAPLVVVRAERSQERWVMTALYAAEAALALGLAALVWRFWLAGVLVLVALDGVLAVAGTALVRALATRCAGEDDGASEEAAQRQASASLNVAFMLCLAAGPAIGGLLVQQLGGPLALVLDAGTFLACGALLARLRIHVEEAAEDSIKARLAAFARHIREVPQLRALLLTEAVTVVFFASVEPVEVIYARVTMHVGAVGFGALMTIWGAGAAIGALAFARLAQRSLGPMLAGGTLLVALAYLGFAVAPSFPFACAVAIFGGMGNGLQWPALVSAVQQLTPSAMHGRLMSALGAMGALCPAIGFSLGGVVAALSSPRPTIAVAGGVATLATLAFARLPLGSLHAAEPAQAVQAAQAVAGSSEPGLVNTPH